MRYYRRDSGGESRLIAADGTEAYDLTAAHGELRSYGDLLAIASIADQDVDAIAAALAPKAESVPPDALGSEPGTPVEPGEVWAAGVTYRISEEARESESELPDVYRDVYESERPELFFKATPERTVGPDEAVGVRADSNWNVPEPELAVVLYRGSVAGYTIGNDVSSREIEGANPLYLPQAKVYDRCCAIGPCVASPDTVGDPHALEISMEIRRDGDTLFEGDTTTAEMVRTCEELVEYYRQHNAVPRLAVLMTGTSIVPPDEVSLSAGDTVSIEVESIGTLENPVVSV